MNKGFINFTEFKNIITRHHFQMNDGDQIEKLFKKLDKDGDELISFEGLEQILL